MLGLGVAAGAGRAVSPEPACPVLSPPACSRPLTLPPYAKPVPHAIPFLCPDSRGPPGSILRPKGGLGGATWPGGEGGLWGQVPLCPCPAAAHLATSTTETTPLPAHTVARKIWGVGPATPPALSCPWGRGSFVTVRARTPRCVEAPGDGGAAWAGGVVPQQDYGVVSTPPIPTRARTHAHTRAREFRLGSGTRAAQQEGRTPTPTTGHPEVLPVPTPPQQSPVSAWHPFLWVATS